jgi:hypothetical protein
MASAAARSGKSWISRDDASWRVAEGICAAEVKRCHPVLCWTGQRQAACVGSWTLTALNIRSAAPGTRLSHDLAAGIMLISPWMPCGPVYDLSFLGTLISCQVFGQVMAQQGRGCILILPPWPASALTARWPIRPRRR